MEGQLHVLRDKLRDTSCKAQRLAADKLASLLSTRFTSKGMKKLRDSVKLIGGCSHLQSVLSNDVIDLVVTFPKGWSVNTLVDNLNAGESGNKGQTRIAWSVQDLRSSFQKETPNVIVRLPDCSQFTIRVEIDSPGTYQKHSSAVRQISNREPVLADAARIAAFFFHLCFESRCLSGGKKRQFSSDWNQRYREIPSYGYGSAFHAFPSGLCFFVCTLEAVLQKAKVVKETAVLEAGGTRMEAREAREINGLDGLRNALTLVGADLKNVLCLVVHFFGAGPTSEAGSLHNQKKYDWRGRSSLMGLLESQRNMDYVEFSGLYGMDKESEEFMRSCFRALQAHLEKAPYLPELLTAGQADPALLDKMLHDPCAKLFDSELYSSAKTKLDAEAQDFEDDNFRRWKLSGYSLESSDILRQQAALAREFGDSAKAKEFSTRAQAVDAHDDETFREHCGGDDPFDDRYDSDNSRDSRGRLKCRHHDKVNDTF